MYAGRYIGIFNTEILLAITVVSFTILRFLMIVTKRICFEEILPTQ